MKFYAYLLFPFSYLYAGIMRTRNWFYDQKILPSQSFSVPVISVGNLTVGGTGKTPHVEFLVRLLKNRKVAILSRGYKRQTKGFVLATPEASPATIGDEPFQYYKAFPPVTVAVCEDRVAGIKQLLTLKPQTEIILLDDAYQHRPVKAHLNILITDYYRLFYQDHVLPAGRLRESRAGANRADIIIVSKAPDFLAETEKASIRRQIQQYSGPHIPVFFTTYKYGAPVSYGKSVALSQHIILVTGIGQPQPLLQYLQHKSFILLKHFCFPDHHAYTEQDMTEISNFARLNVGKTVSILTTQKDWTKLSSFYVQPAFKNLNMFYLPISVQFLDEQEFFENILLSSIDKV